MMTRAEQLSFCTKCTNRNFNPKVGLICNLTGEIADFQGSCASYSEDEQQVKMELLKEKEVKTETTKTINKGRNVLFFIGAFYILMGVYEGFFMMDYDLIYGIVDWFIGAVFIGMGAFSYKKTSLALMIGLGFYILLIILFAAVDATTIFSGILWKVIIISSLFYGIKTAREEEKLVKVVPDDLLDQL